MKHLTLLLATLLLGCADTAARQDATIEISPPITRAAPGVQRPLEAWLRQPDGRVEDVTSRVTWQAHGAASIVQLRGGTPGLRIDQLGQGSISAQLHGTGAAVRVEGIDAPTQQLRIRPLTLTLAPSQSLPLQAFGRFDDGPEIELTDTVRWQPIGPLDALDVRFPRRRVEVHAHAIAQASIEAIMPDGAKASVPVTISDQPPTSLRFGREAVQLPAHTSLPVHVQATFAPNESRDVTELATWRSDDPDLLTATSAPGSRGVLIAHKPGSTTVHAQLGPFTASLPVHISAAKPTAITITPAHGTVFVNQQGQLSASALFDDGLSAYVTQEATWRSSHPDRIFVGNGPQLAGHLTALSPGPVTLSATFQGTTGTLNVEVLP
jgi:hypothetical protein